MIKKILLAVLTFNLLLATFFWFNKGIDKGIFYGDALGYHIYLPALFVYDKLDDIKSIASDSLLDEGMSQFIGKMTQDYSTSGSGQTIIQYTYGVAALYAPAFFAIRIFDKISGTKPSTGFEMRYQNANKCWGICYVLFGLWMLGKLIKKQYGGDAAILSTIVLLFGTNLFWFTFYQSGMSHPVLFFLNCGLLCCTDKIYDTNCKINHLILFAICLGFIFVIRPSDIVVLIIPLLYNIKTKEDLKNRVLFLKTHLLKIIAICLVITFIVALPQLMYWKMMTGNWIYYSYGEQSFNWSKPEVIQGLFSGRNGWLSYTPVMILSIIGLLIKKQNSLSLALYFLLPIYIYIIYSWWCWNYINGFGSRPMIHLYPYLIFPILTLFDVSGKKSKVLIWAFFLMAVIVNLRFVINASEDRLRPDESKNVYNYTTLFKNKLSVEDLNLLDLGFKASDHKSLRKSKNLIELYFDSNKIAFDTLTRNKEYSSIILEYTVTENDLVYEYIRIGGEFRAPEHVHVSYSSCILATTVQRTGRATDDWYGLTINNKIGKRRNQHNEAITISNTYTGLWDNVYFHLPVKKLEMGDKLRIVVWNASKNKMDVRKLFLEKI